MARKTIRVGLIGLGTIGVGTADILLKNSSLLKGRKGIAPELAGIADISSAGLKELPAAAKKIYTRDAYRLINDPSIDIIVELIGGTGVAKEFILAALENGKDVVTANKKLLAIHGSQLITTACKHGTEIRYEASVCGGIPLIRSIQDGLVANRFNSLYGIVNGTTNYILTQMEERGADFMSAVRDAQQKGFAEADYILDTNGADAAQKIAILARVAFGSVYAQKDIYCEGIDRITSEDIRFAAGFGYRIKLLGIILRRTKGLEVRVHPAMIPRDSALASVGNEFNAVLLEGDRTGRELLYGKGAGRYPTASAVVSDVMELARQRVHGIPSRMAESRVTSNALPLVPAPEAVMPYYCRFQAADRPGVLAQISRILAAHKISLSAVSQEGTAVRGSVPIVMVTHEAAEKTMRRAVKKIAALPVVKGSPQVIRIVNIS